MQTLLFSKNQDIAVITFNRPDKMNAFDHRMADELMEVTRQVADDDSIRAVLVNGSGHLFMAGGDIQFFYNQLEKMPLGVLDMVEKLNVSITHLMTMPKPVLASVHGSVAGVGVSLMMACDLIIAAETTKFTMAYSGLGVSPDGGASYNLPRIVGAKKAMEWLLFSDIFSAEDAKNVGLINWVASEEQLTEQTQRILKRLVCGPTKSYAATKKLINQTWNHSLESQLSIEGFSFEACTTTMDFKTGVTSFLKKVKPQFVGK